MNLTKAILLKKTAFIFLVMSAIIFSGCTMQKRPIQPNKGPNITKKSEQARGNSTTLESMRTDKRPGRIKKEIEKLKYVKFASVIIADNSVIIGAITTDSTIDDECWNIRREIEKRARDVDKSVDSVTVTLDPELVGRITDIESRIAAGIPVNDLAWDITEVLRNINFTR